MPLTPREKTILRETSLGAFDNPLALEKGVCPLSLSQPIQFASTEDSLPRKPYLPPGFKLHYTILYLFYIILYTYTILNYILI